MGKQKAWN